MAFIYVKIVLKVMFGIGNNVMWKPFVVSYWMLSQNWLIFEALGLTIFPVEHQRRQSKM